MTNGLSAVAHLLSFPHSFSRYYPLWAKKPHLTKFYLLNVSFHIEYTGISYSMPVYLSPGEQAKRVAIEKVTN